MLKLNDLESRVPEATFPLHALQVSGKTIGLVCDAATAVLPFCPKTYTDTVVNSLEEATPFFSSSAATRSLEFQWCARVTLSVSLSSKWHGLLVRNLFTNASTSHLLPGISDTGSCSRTKWENELKEVMASVEANSELWKAVSTTQSSCGNLHVFLMSEPDVADSLSTSLIDLPLPPAPQVAGNVTTRVLLGNSPHEVTTALQELFTSLLSGTDTTLFAGTEVCWPAELLFPVNVHTRDDALRRAEHAGLLLPNKGLLHHQDALLNWRTWDDLKQHQQQRTQLSSASTTGFRTGESWERHLVTNPHTEMPAAGAAPLLHGAETLLTSGSYDYYHYRVDGFRDDGWGCAYRSLQTVLSWFQHAGLMTAPMPSIRRVQEILYATDPDKANKPKFVGSCDWIGSFEVMLVLQHYMPGLDCTIKRLESGKDLDSDAGVQLLLSEHFRHPHAAPVMIGGSSYAHTILGIHINVNTMEARYLILDPHYSANPTQLKAAIKKGYIGWKDASKFFEIGSWYNLCIPRTDLYDPR